MNTDVDEIIQTVAEEYRVSPKSIIGKTRMRDVSEARQICAYILREQKYKRSDIAQQLNRKPKTIYYELQQEILQNCLELRVVLYYNLSYASDKGKEHSKNKLLCQWKKKG